ncbi:CoA pyrophosphatase [Pseudomaricurvus alkylphenolicus]|uniref:NUDIX hydrolase n=1 Tax=Pseudomaricurvus alkylphenolicus TaxID=1306991 RepID=UPI00141EE1C1|nr:CoA pyrophosphatase [Pseudomaricurvus alkylphenolicus]NIB43011.1 CoA pyrophosphatase [Pseudomaricurvus alkylphenolicus]
MLARVRSFLAASPYPSPDPKDYDKRAAVLIALTDHDDDPRIVLTKRAEHLNSHSGQVSLPGGKWDVEDASLLQTALRESWEEVGLQPELVEVLGALPVVQTYQGVNVAPFVGVVPKDVELVPNYQELDAIFQVPVSFFLRDERVRTDIFNRSVGHAWSPAYHFEGFEIWGFTARLLASFLNEALGADIHKESRAPVMEWG